MNKWRNERTKRKENKGQKKRKSSVKSVNINFTSVVIAKEGVLDDHRNAKVVEKKSI